jgi:TRAP-type C4-dicarboxylate transport system permease small subunit
MASLDTANATGRAAAVGRWVKRLDRVLVLVGSTVAILVIVIVGGTLLTSVVLRYVAGSSLAFATELPSYLFPWLVCGGIVAAAGAAGHLAVDFFVNKLPAKAHRLLTTVMWALVVVSLVLLTLAGGRLFAAFEGQSTPILGWPTVGSYIALPLALAFLSLHAAARTVASAVGVPLVADPLAGEAGMHVESPA